MNNPEMYPKHADPRSYKFFKDYRQVSYSNRIGMVWDSRSATVPTSMYKLRLGGKLLCAYCGNQPYPIQDADCKIIGDTCICKGAMDEVYWVKGYRELLDKQEEEYQDYLDKFPKLNPDTIIEVIKDNTKQVESKLAAGDQVKLLDALLGIELVSKFPPFRETHPPRE